MDGDSSVFVVEYGDEFEACAEGFEVLAKCGDADVFGVFEFGDCALGDIESTGEFYLADCFTVAEFVQPDLFERFAAQFGEAFGCAWAFQDLLAEFGEFLWGH